MTDFMDAEDERYWVVDYTKGREETGMRINDYFNYFWNLEEPRRFNVHLSKYAHKYKFRNWMQTNLDNVKSIFFLLLLYSFEGN